MFDEHSQSCCELDWHQNLSVGDVVSFRFPVAEEDRCRPKARPCLVLEVVALGSGTFLSLAYGTSTETKANRGHDIRAADAKDLSTAGLHKPTRFVGARRILVAPEHPGFVVNRSIGTPILGRLSNRSFQHMKRVRGRIRAEAKIAAAHRAKTQSY